MEPWAVRLARRARVRQRSHPDRQLLRRDRGGRVLPLGHDAGADEAVLRRLSRARRGHGRRRRGGPASSRRGGRARLPARVAGHDARDLGRPGALPGDVLAAIPGHLDTRRLGLRRRGRLLVPPRTLGRHAEHRGQAHRAGRARVRSRRPSRHRRSGGDRRAARGEGRGRLALLCSRAWRRRHRRRGGGGRLRTSSGRRSRPTVSSS